MRCGRVIAGMTLPGAIAQKIRSPVAAVMSAATVKHVAGAVGLCAEWRAPWALRPASVSPRLWLASSPHRPVRPDQPAGVPRWAKVMVPKPHPTPHRRHPTLKRRGAVERHQRLPRAGFLSGRHVCEIRPTTQSSGRWRGG